MAFDTAIGLIIVGIHFVIAYLATQFNPKSQQILQLFFLIITIAMVPFGFGLALAMASEGGASADFINTVQAGYWASIFITITFIALIVLMIIKKTILLPIENQENPYKNWDQEGMIK